MRETIRTLADAERALKPYVDLAFETTGRDITVDRTLRLAALVGNPQERLRVVHIAGTSGKTSTTYYTTALLVAAGKKVGTTVSPHIVSLFERVQLDGKPLSELVFCEYFDEFMQLVEAWDETPTYFEILVVFAMWVFEREGVDYAVLETGLGGLHDSTNIARRRDKLCIITDIGLDHMHILGDTLGEIAAQKAGIIAEANQVVMYEQGSEVMNVVNEQVVRMNATLHALKAPNTSDYRERNFALSLAAYELLAERDGLLALPQADISKAKSTQVPGRLTSLQRGDSQIIADGAHNPQKVRALVATLGSVNPGRRYAVVIAMKHNKDYRAAVDLLAPYASRVITTTFMGTQDMAMHAIDPAQLAEEFESHGVEAGPATDIKTAVDQLVEQKEPYILVTGSLYAVSELLQ